MNSLMTLTYKLDTKRALVWYKWSVVYNVNGVNMYKVIP